jgi:hypothetical protein
LLVDVLFFPDADREELTCTGLVKLEFGSDTNRNLRKMGFGRNIQDSVLAELETTVQLNAVGWYQWGRRWLYFLCNRCLHVKRCPSPCVRKTDPDHVPFSIRDVCLSIKIIERGKKQL